MEADVFIDPGADFTHISPRWIRDQGGTGKWAMPISYEDPAHADHFVLVEDAFIEIGGVELPLGDAVSITPSSSMQGAEDMLLGRDFLSVHHLMLVIDGEESSFSLLLPSDEDNRRRREQIRRALDESALSSEEQ